MGFKSLALVNKISITILSILCQLVGGLSEMFYCVHPYILFKAFMSVYRKGLGFFYSHHTLILYLYFLNSTILFHSWWFFPISVFFL